MRVKLIFLNIREDIRSRTAFATVSYPLLSKMSPLYNYWPYNVIFVWNTTCCFNFANWKMPICFRRISKLCGLREFKIIYSIPLVFRMSTEGQYIK